jgi:hypothetical protein
MVSEQKSDNKKVQKITFSNLKLLNPTQVFICRNL